MATYCAECIQMDLSDEKYNGQYYCQEKGKYYKPTETSCHYFSKRPSISSSGKICNQCSLVDKNDSRYGEYYCVEERKYIKLNSSACNNIVCRQTSGGGCYITTICCEILGFDDNCDILSTLRKFRDKIMIVNESMHPLLQEYDQIGPILVEKINQDSYKFLKARELYYDFLVPCTDLIKKKNYYEAIAKYRAMVHTLKIMYGLIDFSIDYDIKRPLEELGKGRIKQKEVGNV